MMNASDASTDCNVCATQKYRYLILNKRSGASEMRTKYPLSAGCEPWLKLLIWNYGALLLVRTKYALRTKY
jgi:hypothetical protein